MDEVQQMASAPDTGLFGSNGLFSKAIDTAGDAFALVQANRRASVPGTVYPTGQNNPGIIASENAVIDSPSAPTAQKVMAWMPYILAFAGIVIVGAVAYRFAKR